MAVTATYNGPYTKGYLQYIDLASYHTLVAVPGSTYTIGVASGWATLAAIPADGTWTPSAPPQSPALFTSVPGLAVPGAFFPGSPATGGDDAQALAMEAPEASEGEQWAERVVATAGTPDPIYSEIRERLATAGEQLAVLSRKQQP